MKKIAAIFSIISFCFSLQMIAMNQRNDNNQLLQPQGQVIHQPVGTRPTFRQVANDFFQSIHRSFIDADSNQEDIIATIIADDLKRFGKFLYDLPTALRRAWDSEYDEQ